MRLFSLVLAGVLLASSSASAGVRIAWHDLDLNTPEGAQALHDRIDAAARRACAFTFRQERRTFDYHGCRAAFHAEALDLMPQQTRTLYLAGRTPNTAHGAR